MAGAILLLLFVQDELSSDRHHSKHDRIYMVQSIFRYGDKEIFSYRSSYPIGPTLKDEYPVIEESVRTLTSGRIFFMDQKGEITSITRVDMESRRCNCRRKLYWSNRLDCCRWSCT